MISSFPKTSKENEILKINKNKNNINTKEKCIKIKSFL